MQRVSRFLLLAIFLRLQVACCCAAHPAAESNDIAPFRSVRGSSVHTHSHPGDCGHEHKEHGSSDSNKDHCHLCVLTHLQYMAGPHAFTFDFDAATIIAWRLDDLLAPSLDGSVFVASTSSSAGQRLLACNAMLRI